MAKRVWVAQLHISERTADKLADKHGISADDVRSHVQRVGNLRGAWDYHPQRGLRLLLKVPMEEQMILVVLYPRDDSDEAWNLGSAYPVKLGGAGLGSSAR